MSNKEKVFSACGYIALIIAGVWSATKSEYGIAALIFFGFAVLTLSSLLANIGEVDPRAKEEMPDAAEIKHYREQNPGTSITDAINHIVKQRHTH